MSGRANSPRLELKLNLSPPRARARATANNNQQPVIDLPNESPERSCVSSEPEDSTATSRAVVTASMVLAGCPRCLMYVMLSDVDPKCPNCKSTVLLDFLNEEDNNNTSN